VRKAKLDAEKLLSEMRRTITTAKDLETARQTMRDTFETMQSDITTTLGETEKPHRTPLKNLRKDDKVFVHSLNQEGTVLALPNAAKEVLIQAGIMQIKVLLNDLSLADDDSSVKSGKNGLKGGGGSSISRVAKSRAISPEIDLRGMTPEEAIEQADKYLDDAFLSGLADVTLIHGKGTGALRNALHVRLKKHPQVKGFRLGKFGEGETGVTVVTLK